MSKIRTIINGWSNYIFEKPEIELLAMERAKVCGKCENAVWGLIPQFLNDDVKQIEGLECKLCECPLSTLLRSPESSCKLNLWQSKTF